MPSDTRCPDSCRTCVQTVHGKPCANQGKPFYRCPNFERHDTPPADTPRDYGRIFDADAETSEFKAEKAALEAEHDTPRDEVMAALEDVDNALKMVSSWNEPHDGVTGFCADLCDLPGNTAEWPNGQCQTCRVTRLQKAALDAITKVATLRTFIERSQS